MYRLKRFFAIVAVMITAFCAWAEPDVDWTASVKMETATKGIITVNAAITPGYHFYAFPPEGGMNALELDVVPQDGINILGSPTPSIAPTKHYEEVFDQELAWWDKNVSFSIPFEITDKADHKIALKLRWQSCTDESCLAPEKKKLAVKATYATPGLPDDSAKTESPKAEAKNESTNVDTAKTATQQAATTNATEPSATAKETAEASLAADNLMIDAAIDSIYADNVSPATGVAANDELRAKWWSPVETEKPTSNQSPWAILLIGFLGGLAALLTPCVWPLIPMTLSFFLKRTQKQGKKFNSDAILYGISIIVIYLVLGIAITLIFGAGKLNELSTSALFNIIFFAILVIFAISFLGAFNIKLPEKWSNAMDSRAGKTSGIISIFFMAFTLVLVSFSCTGPIIGTLLVEAASQGSLLGPALGMGAFAIGLALPFTFFAFFPSMIKSMPKSGGWLNSVKVVLGFIELILSLKFLSVADLAYGWHILDREVFLALWIVLFFLLGMYLLGKITFKHDDKVEKIGVGRFMLALLPLSFAVYLIPGLWGAPLKATSAFAPPLSTQDFNLYVHEENIIEFDDYDEGMKYALEHNMPVLVDFSGYGCVNCRNMEVAVLDDADVRKTIADNFVFIQMMVDDRKELPHPIEMVNNKGEVEELETVGEKWTFLQNNKFGASSQPYYIILNNQGEPVSPSPVYYLTDPKQFNSWLEAGVGTYRTENNR